MPTYLCVMHEAAEGCDYTIQCGTRVVITTADNIQKAFDSIMEGEYMSTPEAFSTYDHGGEMELENVTMYEIADCDNGQLFEEHRKKMRGELKQQQEEEQNKKDREEYLRLQKKLGIKRDML